MKLKKDNVYKISVPIITNEELERLDYALENDLDKIVQEIIEVVSKDREIIILQKVIKKQQKRNKKLKRKLNQIYGMTAKKQKDYISIDKIEEMIFERKKRLDVEESKFDVNDIENRKACQVARAQLTFLLVDIYKLNKKKGSDNG